MPKKKSFADIKGRCNVWKIYYNELKLNGSFLKEKNQVRSVEINTNIANSRKSEYIHFQECMSYLLTTGIFLGTNSIYGFTSKDYSALRFTIFSWRFLFLALITLVQGFLSVSYFYIVTQEINLGTISFLAFYLWSVLIYFTFIRLSARWPQLAAEISRSGLSDYLDMSCRLKCNLSLAVIMILATVEHCLSILGGIMPLMKCKPKQGIYESYIRSHWNCLFDLGVSYSVILGILLQVITILSTLIQSYSDVFILCISNYLSSIFEQINKKVIQQAEEILPPKKWQKLREDYNQATRLVRCFDSVISTLVFLSFASNLFFICLQLFNVIGNGLYTKNNNLRRFVKNCTDPTDMSGSSLSSGIYIRAGYHVYSVLFLVGRFVAVTMCAARINNAAMSPAISLYRVPSVSFCKEIERFLEQVNNDTVALSGLNFFYVTRGLLLSVIATIITYELVLMQYSDMGSIGQTI